MKTKRLGLRESIIKATDLGIVEDCVLVASQCTHMSPRTRRACERAADKRRIQLFDAERFETTRFQKAVKTNEVNTHDGTGINHY